MCHLRVEVRSLYSAYFILLDFLALCNKLLQTQPLKAQGTHYLKVTIDQKFGLDLTESSACQGDVRGGCLRGVMTGCSCVSCSEWPSRCSQALAAFPPHDGHEACHLCFGFGSGITGYCGHLLGFGHATPPLPTSAIALCFHFGGMSSPALDGQLGKAPCSPRDDVRLSQVFCLLLPCL